MTDTLKPEDTAEQVEAARRFTEEWLERGKHVISESLQSDLRTILSDHARITAELTQCRETLRLKPSESLPAGVTRLTLQVESAEADSKRMDWLETKTVNVRDHARYGSFDRFWAKPSGGDEEDLGPSDIREQIDAARNQESTNGR